MSYYNNNNQSGGSSGYYGGGQQQPPYGGEGYQQHQKQQVPNSSNFQNSYGDPNAWQQQQQQYNVNSNEQQHQPFYNQQQYVPSYVGQQQQQQQQQPQQSPAFWNPAAAANLAAFAMSTAASGGSSDGAMLDLAGAAGKSFLENSSARMIPGLERTMCALRSYFAVDNRYVMLKMKRILFPFLCKQWKRQQKEVAPTSDNAIPPVAYQLPIHDECAPDLYLPLMSGITYVLLSALMYGTAGKFSPEVIPSVTTKCFVTQLLEVALIRLGFYLMQSDVAILDLFSYTGYKYLGLCLNLAVGSLLGHSGVFGLAAGGTRGYYVMFLWTASAAAYTMLKTMANNIPLQTAPQGPKREIMVIAIAASQFATMWFVGQTKFL